jgi:hypothetical protein
MKSKPQESDHHRLHLPRDAGGVIVQGGAPV